MQKTSMIKYLAPVFSLGLLASGSALSQSVTTKAPFTVTLGGSIRSAFVILNDKEANASSREGRIDYRLDLKAEAKAENGLTYGFAMRLRNNQNSSGQANQDVVGADRKYVYASGSWGRVELGDSITPDSELGIYAPTVGQGQADVDWGPSLGQYRFKHINEGTFDTKLVYYTPTFSGFRAGVAYTPERGSRSRDNARSTYITGSGNNYRNLLAVGLGYTGKFSDVGISLGGGLQVGDAKDISATQKATIGDYQVWHLGAQVSYAGFAVGAHYYNNGDTTLAKGDDQFGWQLGLTYTTGAWGLGASYARVETDYIQRGKADTTDAVWGIGLAYQVAPGLSLQADVVRFVAESQTTSLKAGATKNEGTMIALRSRLDF